MRDFKPNALPLLVGSLPMDNHIEAAKLMLKYTPEIPLWVQLPMYKEEGMLYQFLTGMPGLTVKDKDSDKDIKEKEFYIDTYKETFEDEVLSFYESYMSIAEGNCDLDDKAWSNFALTDDTAKGFSVFMDIVSSISLKTVSNNPLSDKPVETESVKIVEIKPIAVKGQVTGPITMGIGVKDQNGRLLFYDERMKDIVIKQVAMNAKWQTLMLLKLNTPQKPIIFFDEPGVVGFGSSAYISITRDQITEALKEGIDAVHQAGGIAGIHICANGDWSLALESGTDIINFDAYSYFDRLILYKKPLIEFINNGGILAWGIVPTANPEYVEKASVNSLLEMWNLQVKQLEAFGITREKIISQSLITPSCGTGSLTLEHAEKVLSLTKELSKHILSLRNDEIK